MKVYLINSDPDSGPSAIYLTREEADRHCETFHGCDVDEHEIDTLPAEACQGLHLYRAYLRQNHTGLGHVHTSPLSENTEVYTKETTSKGSLPERTFVACLWAKDRPAANEQALQQIKEKFGL